MRGLKLVLVPALLAVTGAARLGGQEGTASFPSGAQVVVLDIVATDGKGRPVEDLRREEISVSEDGKACEILGFRQVRARTLTPPASPTAPAAAATAPAEAPTAGVSVTPVRPSLVVLLFDRLTTTTAPLARRGALDLVSREFPADTWFAVMKIHYGVRLLAPFTTRPEDLRRAIQEATSGEPDLRGPLPPLSPPIAPTSPPGAPVAQDPVRPTDPGSPRMPNLSEVADAVGRELASLSSRVGGYDSLYAVLGLARSLAAVEGRKSVVYFAEAWHLPVGVQPVYDDAVSTANRANVAIHTVDARGLTAHKPQALTPIDTALGRFTADYQRGDNALVLAEAGGVPGREPGLRAKMEPMEERLSGPRLERLAEDTGGLAIASTNDLGAGLAGVAQELRQYYEVVYAPANPEQDGRFRRIAARVARPGVRLRTRAGYFATPERAARLATYELPLMAALAASTPARDFTLTPVVLHFAPKGPERECVVLAEVPLSEVYMARDTAAGVHRGRLTLLGFVKDEGGGVVARLTHDWEIESPHENATTRARTAVFRKTLRLAPGRYVLELAVQDRRAGGTSVAREDFEVPQAAPDLALGSVAVVRRAGAAAADSPAVGDPLRVGDVSLVPALREPLDPDSSPQVPVFVAIYPGRNADPVELTVAFLRDGREIARATPELAPVDSEGRIAWIGSFPAAQLGAGTYKVVVTAKQGEALAQEATQFDVAAATSNAPAP